VSETAARRVIVVEDEALIRMDIVEVLRENGFDVVGEASDGETAISLTRELLPDLVVMDITMPKMDGLTAAEAINKERLAPVVMLTAFAQPEFVARAVEAGAIAYVVKPFTPERLLPQIEVALSRHQMMRAVEAEASDAIERLETRKTLERAKGLLQEKMKLSEPEAFRWIQKASMDRRLTMTEVSLAVIEQLNPST
jgi:AmiR/NasT family two-component response regulator